MAVNPKEDTSDAVKLINASREEKREAQRKELMRQGLLRRENTLKKK